MKSKILRYRRSHHITRTYQNKDTQHYRKAAIAIMQIHILILTLEIS